MTDAELRDAAVAELTKTTVGYAYFTRKGVEPPPSSAWGKALTLLDQIGAVPAFGDLIPKPFPEITGAEARVGTLAELQSALANPAYPVIRLTAMIQLPGGVLDLNRSNFYMYGSGPGTGLRGTVAMSGSKVRLRGFELVGDQAYPSRFGGVRIDSTAGVQTDIDLDGLWIHRVVSGQGVLIQDQVTLENLWVRGCRIEKIRGQDGAAADGHCLYLGGNLAHPPRHIYVYSNLLVCDGFDGDGGAFGVQCYPGPRDVLISGNTIVEAQAAAVGGRGGIVISSNAQRVNSVGNVVAYPQFGCFEVGTGAVDDCRADDTIFWGAPFLTAGYAALPNSNTLNADPLFANRSAGDYRLQPGSPALRHVRPERYGLLPATYRDGSPRLTAAAGSEPPA